MSACWNNTSNLKQVVDRDMKKINAVHNGCHVFWLVKSYLMRICTTRQTVTIWQKKLNLKGSNDWEMWSERAKTGFLK